MSLESLIKYITLAPYLAFQFIVWLYMTISLTKAVVWGVMSWEQELPDYWIIIAMVYFIWTNFLIKEANAK